MRHHLTNAEALTAARALFKSCARTDIPFTDVSDAALDALAEKYGTTDIDDRDRLEAETLIDDHMARMDCAPLTEELLSSFK